MAHPLTTGLLAQTEAASLAPILLVEIETASDPVYFWSGYGTLAWNGQSWSGVGELLGFDAVPETSEVQAAAVSLTLSGVPSSLVGLAINNLRRYLPASIWLGALDGSGNIIADPFQIRNGRVDACSISDDGTTATITVSIESRLIAMKNPRERRYSDQDQKLERPYDDGFKMVNQLQNAQIIWGNFRV